MLVFYNKKKTTRMVKMKKRIDGGREEEFGSEGGGREVGVHAWPPSGLGHLPIFKKESYKLWSWTCSHWFKRRQEDKKKRKENEEGEGCVVQAFIFSKNEIMLLL